MKDEDILSASVDLNKPLERTTLKFRVELITKLADGVF